MITTTMASADDAPLNRIAEGDPDTADQTLYDRVVDALRTVYDPEIPVDIWQLGLVYGVTIGDDGVVAVEMTLTAPSCPVAGEMPGIVQRTVAAVDGVSDCTVELVWEPPWDPSRMTDEAKVQLDMFY